MGSYFTKYTFGIILLPSMNIEHKNHQQNLLHMNGFERKMNWHFYFAFGNLLHSCIFTGVQELNPIFILNHSSLALE